MSYKNIEPKFLRLKQVLQIIPIGRSCWLAGVKSGRYPKPVKLSEKVVAWRVEDIDAYIQSLSIQTTHEGARQRVRTPSKKERV
jgi:prophage regulatory protein